MGTQGEVEFAIDNGGMHKCIMCKLQFQGQESAWLYYTLMNYEERMPAYADSLQHASSGAHAMLTACSMHHQARMLQRLTLSIGYKKIYPSGLGALWKLLNPREA